MQDFMPLLGWDHVELWVGNAKQSAYFYERALGFTRTAYAGPETGIRDRASYVLEQGDIRLVLTTALREDHEISRHQAHHGDGVRDIALTVPDATEAYRQAVQRGASGVREPTKIEDEHRAEKRRDAEDVREVDDAVGPDTGITHGVAQGGTLEPHQQIGHVASGCYLRSG